MAQGILIDDKGRAWSDRSWEVARRIGYRHPTLDLAAFAVRERGFIHIRPQHGGARVALRPGRFGPETLGGALYELKDRQSRRIMLAMFSADEWFYEVLAGVWEFADRAEPLLAGGPVALRHRWLAMERGLAALSLPSFAQLRPLLALWQQSRGRLTEDLTPVLERSGLLQRAVLLRQPPASSRLLVEHFGSGIKILRPCESLLAVGRDFEDMPDRAYGDWAARTYGATLASRRLRFESVRAEIGTSEAATIRIRYDRLLMPWRSAGREALILGVSMRRELSTVA